MCSRRQLFCHSAKLSVCQSNVFCESVTIKIGNKKVYSLKRHIKANEGESRSRYRLCVPSGWRRKLSLRREFSPAPSQHLPRCRWGGAVAVLADGLDGRIKTGDPLSSSFPIGSSVRCNALCSRRARSEECVRAYDLTVPLLLRHRGEWDHGDRT